MDAQHVRSSVAAVVDHLQRNPATAMSRDSAVVAVLEDGLRCRVQAPNGDVIRSDMSKALGGEGSAPSPGWLLRAAIASCDATMIALRAAVEGVVLSKLEVMVESDSDDRGVVGADDAVPPGPLRIRVRARVVSDASPEHLRQIVDWAERHSPVADAVRRSVPMSMTMTIEGA